MSEFDQPGHVSAEKGCMILGVSALAIALISALVIWSGTSDSSSTASKSCEGHSDCPGAGICKSGQCTEWSGSQAGAKYGTKEDPPEEAKPTLNNSEGSAYVWCKALVKERLMQPSTADFPWLADSTQKIDATRYLVRSHVEAKNALGATVRTNWLCEAQYLGDTFVVNRLLFLE